MIPKIIHYCWFGGKPLPELALKCISSWKKNCPDYEIVEWNETNFDLYSCCFVTEAYETKKWAYMSDYARLKIIYEYGGIYLDTDVELIRPLDPLLSEHCFLAAEISGYVATGLGFGAEAHNRIVKMMLDEYTGSHFILKDGNYDMEPCPVKNTRPLARLGYLYSADSIWKNEYCTVYPPSFFCPLNYLTKEMKLTEDTYSIHLYNASWHSLLDDIILYVEGEHKTGVEYRIRRSISFPLRVINKIRKNGFKNTVLLIKSRLQ